MTIVAGVSKLNDKKKIEYKIDYIKPNENYYGSNKKNIHDIGLIRVLGLMKFNDRVNRIPMSYELLDEFNATAVLTGWGDDEVPVLHIL